MNKYYIEGSGVEYDNLQAGPEFSVDLRNVTVSGAVNRGDLLAGVSGVYTTAANDADIGKTLCIAAENNESTDAAVISAYFAGRFNIGGLSIGGITDTFSLNEKLRTENIILTKNREV